MADLGPATLTELRCAPEPGWIDEIKWNDSGIEITAYLNQPTTRVLNPETGELIETRTGAEVIAPPPPIQESLVLDGPERYWIEAAIPSPDGKLIVIAAPSAIRAGPISKAPMVAERPLRRRRAMGKGPGDDGEETQDQGCLVAEPIESPMLISP